MPLSVLDIFPDGTATPPKDDALTGPGTYRWWHFDLSDPELSGWLHAHLPTIPADALLQPETRPRCDVYENGLILNLRGINLNEGQPADQMVSIRMWVDMDVVITVRVRRVFAIEGMLASPPPLTPAAWLEALIERLTNRVQEEVLQLSNRTEFYEDDLEDDSTPLPLDLPVSRRQVIRLRRYLDPQRKALNQLVTTELPLIPAKDALQLRELANRTTLAVEELDALRERLMAVQDEHDLHVARRQSKHGYILSLAAGVFLPLGFLTGLFGVNIAGMPGLSNPWAFAILCGTMTGLAVALLAILKWTRWW